MYLASLLCMSHVTIILFSLIWSYEYLVRNTSHEPPHSQHFILGQCRSKWSVKFLDSLMHCQWNISIDFAVDISLMQQMLIVAGRLLFLQCHQSTRCQRRRWHIWFSHLDLKHQAVLFDNHHFSACIITFHTGMSTSLGALISRKVVAN